MKNQGLKLCQWKRLYINYKSYYPSYLIVLLVQFGVVISPAYSEAKETTPLPIETDRPDFTESTETVPLAWLQIESGMTYQWTENGEGISLPELLFRYSIAKDLEFRLGAPDYNRFIEDGSSDTGFGDTYVGFKYRLASHSDGHGWALIPALNIPSGDDTYSAEHVDPELKLCWSKDFAETWGIASMAYGKSTSSPEETVFEYQHTVSLAKDLTEDIGSFYEYAGTFAEDSAPDHVLHTGLTYGPDDNSQIDLHGGFSMNGSDRKPFLAAGYSIRF